MAVAALAILPGLNVNAYVLEVVEEGVFIVGGNAAEESRMTSRLAATERFRTLCKTGPLGSEIPDSSNLPWPCGRVVRGKRVIFFNGQTSLRAQRKKQAWSEVEGERQV
ncbi:hypothetical protein DFH09DRAFT_1090176 [Mycena vulgaris]|nr:hypothetical protein DFH09DRAFT_1090176 [Mycena vulgaris]